MRRAGTRQVYRVGTDPDPGLEITGGKAASLYRMTALGIAIPPAFVVSTDACRRYLDTGRLPDGLFDEIREAMTWLEATTGRVFGGDPPLLVSVRSGAAISMPGMMDTLLNLGLTDETEKALADALGAECAAATRDRFRRSYPSDVVVPENPWEQLRTAVEAVFESWNSPRAVAYRKRGRISDELGTAVTVQAMVLGHSGERSGTGVVFSRDPLTGERRLFGEWLPRAQGEDLVSGEVDGRPLAELASQLPDVYAELESHVATLERVGADLQDVEFTVEEGKLWLLQARAAKRSPLAAIRTAVEMAREGLIDTDTALSRVRPEQVRQLCLPTIAPEARERASVLARGEPACLGIGIGVVAGSTAGIEALDEDAVLARETTSPEDFPGMAQSVAVITEHGGATSHAAVVSREMGVPCVVGCGSGTVTGLVGRTVTVDGAAGLVFDGALPLTERDERADDHLAQLLQWARTAASVDVLFPGEVPADLPVYDLGETPPPGGAFAVTGSAFESSSQAAGAVDRACRLGAAAIVTEHRLPVLLECIRREASVK
ncbi:pyruvate, phosphate dikinase [Streptomyces sp. NPDC005373]|uniref:pyruvate, phosphate dikinase n=1 Tax=Streptomyces sp. NPDC005373 TaxID=3156879 RepID=UPI0033A0F472